MQNVKTAGKIHHGFTLIEVILVITIFSLLAGLAGVNLIKPQEKVTLGSTVTTLVADLKEQQTRAMSGDTAGMPSPTPVPQNFGVYFEQTRYILFTGPGYKASDPANFVVNIDPGLSLYFNLPGSQIIFSSGSGEWADNSPSPPPTSPYSIIVQSNFGSLTSPQASGTTCADADVNDDGRVNNTDLLVIATKLSPPYIYKYDVNHDGTVNADDQTAIGKMIGCTISTPPPATEKKTITVNRYGAITVN